MKNITYLNNISLKADGKFNSSGILVEGILEYPNGMIEEGRFDEKGLKSGKRIFPDESFAEGEFLNGFFVKGKRIDVDGNIFIGYFDILLFYTLCVRQNSNF